MRSLSFQWLAMIAAIASATVIASCVTPRATSVPTLRPLPREETPEPSDSTDLSEQLIQAHNQKRAKAGLPPLIANSKLQAAAMDHAQDMAERRRMSHKGGDGTSPFDRITHEGFAFRVAAENVAYGFVDVDSVMAGWMKSQGHRRNILGKFSEIGVGRAIASDGAAYWCVTFGTPLEQGNSLRSASRGLSLP